MCDEFSGKVVIITGANSGLGRAMAIHFAKKGAKVCLSGRDQKRLEAVSQECSDAGKRSVQSSFLVVAGDVTADQTRQEIIEKTVKKFGQLDVLVNNAGISFPNSGPQTTDEETYDRVMDVNLKAAFFLSQMAIPHLQESSGCIVNVSSILSTIVGPKLMVYAMSKAGVDHMTRTMAAGLAPLGIRVNAVNPSWVPGTAITREFPITPQGDPQTLICQNETAKQPLFGTFVMPDDIAHTVCFLASGESARFITGQCHVVDGGRTFLGMS